MCHFSTVLRDFRLLLLEDFNTGFSSLSIDKLLFSTVGRLILRLLSLGFSFSGSPSVIVGFSSTVVGREYLFFFFCKTMHF